MVITKTVGDLLFNGYEDPLIAVAETLPALANVDIPFDKFGWFYTRNGSSSYDGIFNMDTGADDINKLGRLREWNHSNRTDFYEGHCGDIVGSAGELWPPKRKKDSISMFSSDLCRSIELPFESETELMGIPAYRFVGGRGLVDNGTLDKSNECYCGGQCMPIGVVNASSCRYGSPAFVSYPHFLDADPYYSSLIRGMSPDRDKHSFYIVVEPKTGIPMDVAARLQINILMQPFKDISMYQNVPTALFPMIWFEQTATMTPEMALSLSMLLALSEWGVYLCIATLAMGILLLAFVAIEIVSSFACRKTSRRMLKMEMKMQSPNSHVIQPLVPALGDRRTKVDEASPRILSRAPRAVAEDTDEYANGYDEFSSLRDSSPNHHYPDHEGLYPSIRS